MKAFHILAQTSSYEAGERIGRILGIFLFPLIMMLIFGSANYGINRIRGNAMTFKQAILAKWVVMASVILWVLGLAGQLVK